jgi:hypothetical protein
VRITPISHAIRPPARTLLNAPRAKACELGVSLEYLQRVESAGTTSKSERFLALTIIRDGIDEHIVTYIFICNDDARARLKVLHLLPPSNGLGEYVERLLQKMEHAQGYRVFEDRCTLSDDVRVFIGRDTPPQGSIGLDAFTAPVSDAFPESAGRSRGRGENHD